MENLYCRFCAEPKSSEKLLNLQNNIEKHEEIVLKLAFMNAVYVDVSNTENMLPKTACLVCYDNLNKAYEFLDSVKRAQVVLANIFTSTDDTKYDRIIWDDDRTSGIEEFISHEDGGCVKSEDEKPSKSNEVEVLVEVKQELKEEPDLDDTVCNTLNVEEVVDVAICDNSLSSNVTIDAKNSSDFSKKDVKTWQDYRWLCRYCDVEFMNIDMLRSHCKVVHGKCMAFKCIDCKVQNESFSAFVKHVGKHRKSLRDHCFYCDFTNDKLLKLPAHLKSHFTESQLSCPLCGEIFKNEELMKIHLREFNVAKLERRPRRKPGTPITIEELTCNLCNKVYKNLNSLRDHKKVQHLLNRKMDYTCERCGKMFYNNSTLTSHILFAHDKNRPHVCKICNNSFSYPNELRRHVEIHDGVKPFSCEQCGRCFRQKRHLNAHKIIHTDAKPYVCKYCNKAFRFESVLRIHHLQHTGAKPYTCQDCSREFTNWANYNKHMKRRHGKDTAKKKITFPVNPETGQIKQVDESIKEWKTRIMVPGKRGKKKVIKQKDI